jgi:hypothetical protein
LPRPSRRGFPLLLSAIQHQSRLIRGHYPLKRAHARHLWPFLWHTARPMCCSRPGMPPLCTPPSAHHGLSQVRSDSYASMLIPSGCICCRYPSRCTSLPARPSSDPTAFRRPRSLPCTVLESRSPGAGTLTSSPLVFLVFGDIRPATTQLHGAPARRFAAPFPLLQLIMAATSVYCDLCASRCCSREAPRVPSCAVPVPSTSCFPVRAGFLFWSI